MKKLIVILMTALFGMKVAPAFCQNSLDLSASFKSKMDSLSGNKPVHFLNRANVSISHFLFTSDKTALETPDIPVPQVPLWLWFQQNSLINFQKQIKYQIALNYIEYDWQYQMPGIKL